MYNWGTTGNPLVPGYVQLYGPSHGIGFGQGSWGPPHTLGRGLRHAGRTLRALNSDLFRWPLSSLWPLLLTLLPARLFRARAATSRGTRGATGLLFAVPAVLIGAHVFYWYHDLCFGPRYVYEALGPILVLCAAGLLRLGDLLARLGRAPKDARSRYRPLAAVLLVCFAAAFAFGWPVLFRPPQEFAGAAPGSGPRMASYFQYYSRQYWGVGAYPGELVDREVRERSLVFVRLLEPEVDLPQFRYLSFGSAFARMRPDLRRSRVVYARDLGPRNRELAEAFPDRDVYLYTGTIESGRLQLLRGPLGR